MQIVYVLSLWARMGTGLSIGTFMVRGCTKRSQSKQCLPNTGMERCFHKSLQEIMAFIFVSVYKRKLCKKHFHSDNYDREKKRRGRPPKKSEDRLAT